MLRQPASGSRGCGGMPARAARGTRSIGSSRQSSGAARKASRSSFRVKAPARVRGGHRLARSANRHGRALLLSSMSPSSRAPWRRLGGSLLAQSRCRGASARGRAVLQSVRKPRSDGGRRSAAASVARTAEDAVGAFRGRSRLAHDPPEVDAQVRRVRSRRLGGRDTARRCGSERRHP